MLQNIRSILIGITEEGEAEERSSALAYGLSLARQANAHVTVQAASLKLTLTHAFISAFAEGLVAAENRRLDALARAVADSSQRAAAASGVSLHHAGAAACLSGPHQELQLPRPRP